MNANEAAEKIREHVKPEQAKPEFRHNVNFVESVTRALGLEVNLLNALCVGRALDNAKISADSREYPKMLFTRDEPAEGTEATYDERHKCWNTIAADEEAEKALKGHWVESLEKLPGLSPTAP